MPPHGRSESSQSRTTIRFRLLSFGKFGCVRGCGLEEPSMTKGYQNDQLELAAQRFCYSSSSRYKARGEFLFAGISLAGAHVLEVGCGSGTWGIWAALHDADRVVGIDPEAHGSSSGDFATCQQTIETLGILTKVIAY